ncbi:MAG: aminoacyl-tRNA hydrolase [Candidatus Liptonbacteria bacterium]|nr:aminoacyl-tRNA hydrolase [Candidatus Liptonbacteria bacterium]
MRSGPIASAMKIVSSLILPPRVRILLGLGNPSRAYGRTYHNAGILAVRWLAKRAGGGRPLPRQDRKGLYALTSADGLRFAESRTAMNESGRAAGGLLRALRAKPEELLVLHDDSDIALGAAKLSFGRGAAGHRGVASVIASLRTNRFWRLRIGIRKGEGKAGAFVLTPMPRKDVLACYSAIRALTTKSMEKSTLP